MHATAISQTEFRGVSCRRCGKPIRLSASFLKREDAIKQDESGRKSKVFSARCRRCHAEGIYEMGQIVDIPLLPHRHAAGPYAE
jgi:hypothetical protein